MELLDRYVRAVKTYLPRAQQDDIVKELSANLQAQMEDREAELGRPLSEAELEALLELRPSTQDVQAAPSSPPGPTELPHAEDWVPNV